MNKKTKKSFYILLAILFAIILPINIFSQDVGIGGSSGTPIYNQQTTGRSDLDSTSMSSNGSVTQSYQMGHVALSYSSSGGWDIGFGMITRSTKYGIPTYNDANDTFYLGGEELVLITTSTNPWIYRTKKESFKKICLQNPNTKTSYWIVYNPDGSAEYYGNSTYYKGNTSMIIGKGGMPRAWAIAEIRSRGGYDVTDYEYINILGQYLLQRVISGKSGCIPDKMTFIDYTYNQTYQKVDYRAGCEVIIQHYPLIVYTFSGTTTTDNPYPWLIDWQGKPFASRYYLDATNTAYKNYNLTGLYYIKSSFNDAGKWQVNSIQPYGNDVKTSGITRAENNIINTWGIDPRHLS